MKRYTKIPDEWVGEWGLSWTEAAVLADLLVWDCTIRERAVRCHISERTAYNAMAKIMSTEPAKIAVECLQKLQKKSAKIADGDMQKLQTEYAKIAEKQKEKKKTPPTPPIKNKKKTQEEQLLFSPSASDGGEKKEEVKVYSLQHRCKSYYEQEFKKFKGFDYYYEGADAGNLSQLLKKLKNAYEKIYGQQPTDDETETFFQSFINSLIIYKPDKFVDDKFTLRVINSQFNVVFPKLLKGEYGNERQQQQQSGPTDDFLRRVAAEVEANGGLAF